ncbi:MAG: hypothetical protein M0Q22_01775 [Sulfuritalea sp.]|jgi:hypothetical protein|nr:hypothetical protein [Sulfuritalea sp.]
MAGMTQLRTTVNSFDLFDTLVARRCIDSFGILMAVEQAFNAKGFAVARRDAEFRIAGMRRAFDIYDIYDILVAAGTLARDDADKLLAAEVEAEFDNAVPIVENIDRVREGDLVITDMYLPQNLLRLLLQHIGLRKHIHLYATNLGKHHGDVWSDIASRWIICSHTGDNLHSDVASPQGWGVPTAHYAGAQPSQIESIVMAQGFPLLARIMRSLRLTNPFPPGSQDAELWLLACQLNLPLLVFLVRLVRARRDATRANKILFSARDCYLLSEIFSTLYPGERSEYLYVSREVLVAGGPAEEDYLVGNGLGDSLVCDLAATGSSWYEFSRRSEIRVNLFSLIFIDNWPLARVAPDLVVNAPNLTFGYALRSSALSCYSPGIEVLNSAPHGSCLGIVPTGRFFSPHLLPANELGNEVLTPLLQCHEAAVSALKRDRKGIVQELGASPPDQLMNKLVEEISGSTLLNLLEKRLLWPPSFGRMTN